MREYQKYINLKRINENSISEMLNNFLIPFETMAESVIDTMITDEGEEMYDIEDTLKYHFEPYYNFMN